MVVLVSVMKTNANSTYTYSKACGELFSKTVFNTFIQMGLGETEEWIHERLIKVE